MIGILKHFRVADDVLNNPTASRYNQDDRRQQREPRGGCRSLGHQVWKPKVLQIPRLSHSSPVHRRRSMDNSKEGESKHIASRTQ